MDRPLLGDLMNRHVLLLAACSLLNVATACNPRYCAGNPDNDCRKSWDAGPKLCKGDGDCAAPMGVCDLDATMMCVQCTPGEPGACSGATPACVANQCQKCTMHTQCAASNVCLPDGSCAAEQQVAYVASGGAGTTCTKASPCGTLDDGQKAGRPYVKVAAGTVTDIKTTTIDGRAVTILADPGAQISRTNAGVILQVQNDGADVQIFDLEIMGGIGAANPAISIPSGGAPKLTLTRVKVDGNQGIGILASAGMLTMSRSIVSTNTGGGISISGAEFQITNTMIVMNGGVTSASGGLKIDGITVAGTHALDFNTVTANIGPMTINTGITCGTVLVPLVFSSDIVYANIVSGGGVQLGGSANCSTTYSDIGPDTTPGTGNINLDPMFVSPLQANFHLKVTSPVKDVADPAATLIDDIDGDARPQGPRHDMGADEIKL
jgi:hypothetical protein